MDNNNYTNANNSLLILDSNEKIDSAKSKIEDINSEASTYLRKYQQYKYKYDKLQYYNIVYKYIIFLMLIILLFMGLCLGNMINSMQTYIISMIITIIMVFYIIYAVYINNIGRDEFNWAKYKNNILIANTGQKKYDVCKN